MPNVMIKKETKGHHVENYLDRANISLLQSYSETSDSYTAYLLVFSLCTLVLTAVTL